MYLLQAQAIDNPQSGFKIVTEDKVIIDSRLWFQEQFPQLQIEGGTTPFILEATGLPKGLRAYLTQDGQGIQFSGLPSPGTYDVSLALIDKESNTTHTNVQMEIEPLLLNSAQKVLNEWALYLGDDLPTTYNMTEIGNIATLLNLILE